VQRLLTAQREISDNIEHELRTPLVHLDTRLLHAIDHRGGSVCLNRPARFLSGAAAGFMPLREAVG